MLPARGSASPPWAARISPLPQRPRGPDRNRPQVPLWVEPLCNLGPDSAPVTHSGWPLGHNGEIPLVLSRLLACRIGSRPQKSICNPSCKILGAFSCELSTPNDCGDCRLTDGSAN